MRLIDADALLEAMKKADKVDPELSTYWSRGSISRTIKQLPTVDAVPIDEHRKLCHEFYLQGKMEGAFEATQNTDAVPVVRCKDCKHMERIIAGCYCKVWSGFNGYGSDGFCSYGERRSGDE